MLNVNKLRIRVRPWCVDAPDTTQAFGTKSKQALSSLVFGKDITVVERDRDRYARTVGHAVVAGVNVNKRVVELGLAWVQRQYCRDVAIGRLG